jgi:hypothetical protein
LLIGFPLGLSGQIEGTDATGNLRATALVFGVIAWPIQALMNNIPWLSERRLDG